MLDYGLVNASKFGLDWYGDWGQVSFVSAAHTDADIVATVAAARDCFKLLAK